MWEFIKAGGWLMLPLFLCSIAALTISIERFIRLKKSLVAPENLLDHLLTREENGGLTSQEEIDLFNSPVGQVLKKAHIYRHKSAEFAQSQMQTEASVQIAHLEKNINFLGTIGAIAPLLGLLGTVLGIIEAFLAVNTGGVTDPAMLATGVSKALITTAAGMIVAIPALIAYRYFQRVVVELVVKMEQSATLYHAALFHDKLSTHQATPTQARSSVSTIGE